MKTATLLKDKILSDIDLERWLTISRFRRNKIVFTNGCFDIVHRGHIEYLAAASDLGDQLVVGLNTDASVRKLKGDARPYLDEEARAMLLAALSFVSLIVFFDEETPLNLIKQVRPDILVKGSDYQPEEIAGYEFVTSYGGQVLTLDLIPGYSTSSIIQKISAGDH